MSTSAIASRYEQVAVMRRTRPVTPFSSVIILSVLRIISMDASERVKPSQQVWVALPTRGISGSG
jgi:hypothetical protein